MTEQKNIHCGSDIADELVKAFESKLFKALSEPVRAQILRTLMMVGRSDISSISENMPQDRSVISRHLNLMAEAGILNTEKEGRHVYYRIHGKAFLEEFERIVELLRECLSSCCP